MAAGVIWILIIYVISQSSGQTLRQYTNTTLRNQGVCRSVPCNSLRTFYRAYKDCVVVLGNLQVTIMERTKSEDFIGISFPNLREVTGFLVVYRVKGLASLGQLFPNLARIRGEQLLNNYGLIVHDMSTLTEIGLYGLVKIDRGGVIVWGVPHACFVDTVDWKTIAPRSRHVINSEKGLVHCNVACSCSDNATVNHCWNKWKCQLFLDGPEADKCHEQCLGCRKTRSTVCSICRYYTHNSRCVSKCPSDTVILPDSQYCLTRAECKNLTGWVWNNTCVFHCPVDYVEQKTADEITCKYCADCHRTCGDVTIQTTSAVQAAEHCVLINGSLTIHLRAVPEAMEELRTYLSRIEEVSDFIVIYGSLTISSLDFFSSLQRIRGRKLKDDKYSLLVHDMSSLQTLFSKNVIKNLQINRGTMKIYNNPILCSNHINNIKHLFPVKPNDIDIPTGTNGYSGGCEEVSVGIQIQVSSETSARIMFSATIEYDAHYTLLYVRLPQGVNSLVPESCSELEWHAINVQTSFGHQFGVVELKRLRPASTYAVCIESYDPVQGKLARSSILNFTTFIGTPEPPFIRELAAKNSGAVVLRWVDHKDYKPHLTRYELDVSLLEIYERDIIVKDQCKHTEATEPDLTRHAVVMRPPPDYARGCESMCGILSSVTEGALTEEDFDICSVIGCDAHEDYIISQNSSFGKYVRTMILNLTSPKDDFQIGSLAPYRDYRFRLRACTKYRCSRSARGVVRTFALKKADVPNVYYATANEIGQVTVKWDPPELTNGPILSYSIEVIPKINHDTLSNLLPQSSCVLANQTDNTVMSVKANKYLVRVCTKSMAFDSICSEWKTVVSFMGMSPALWWTGVAFGVLINIASIAIGCLLKRRNDNSDLVPIVDLSSTLANESEAPSKMFSDFTMFTIPLRDTQL